MSLEISSKRYCSDDRSKVVTRIYNWDGKLIEINLCEDHKKDPDFQNYVKEIPIQEITA